MNGTLAKLDVFHSEIEDLLSNECDILQKIRLSKMIEICGDTDANLFKKLYLNLMTAIIKRMSMKSRFYSPIGLFSSPSNQIQSRKLLEEEKEESPIYVIFELFLGKDTQNIDEFKTFESEAESIFLKVDLLKGSSNLEYLLEALKSEKIIGIELFIWEKFDSFETLFEIIKDKKFRIFSISRNEITPNFINFLEKLTKKLSFWSTIETLRMLRIPFNVIHSVLKAVQPQLLQLKRLEIDLLKGICIRTSKIKKEKATTEPSDSTTFSQKKVYQKLNIQSLKELHIELVNFKKNKKSFEALLHIFPDLEKFSVYSDSDNLDTFEVKNSKIKAIKICCGYLANECEFVMKMFDSQLTNVEIIQDCWGNGLKWKRCNGRVYYDFLVRDKEKVVKSCKEWKSKPQELKI